MPTVLSKLSSMEWKVGAVEHHAGYTLITSTDFHEYDYPASYLDGAGLRENMDAGNLFIPTLTMPMLLVLQEQHCAQPEVVAP